MVQRIILSKHVEILDRPEYTELGLAENFSFLKKRGKIITITPVMREILEFIRVPRTAEEVVQFLSDSQDCSFVMISPTVCTFLNRMLKFGAIAFAEID